MPEWDEEISRLLASLKLSPTREAEIVEELSQHLEDRYQESLAAGTNEEDAHRAALAELHESHRLAHELGRLEMRVTRDPVVLGARRKNMLGDLWQDMRFAVRMFGKNPALTLVAVITLALGIGANTAIFSVVNAVLLRPLPYSNPERIMRIWATQPQNNSNSQVLSAPNFIDLRERNQIFEEIAAYRGWAYIITGAGEPHRVFGQRVSSDFFDLLGAAAERGRAFLPDEDQPGKDNVVVLSHGFWQNNLGADPEIVGRSLVINDVSRTVVGVMLSDFYFQSRDNALWVPLAFAPADLNRALGNLSVIARLKPAATIQQAQSELNALAEGLEQQYPENKGRGIRVVSLHEETVGKIRLALLTLLGAVGFVLAVACANVANLQLNRALSRQKEIAIRAALGASRWRIVRQLLAENLLLSVAGGGVGALVAFFSLGPLIRLATEEIPRVEQAAVDPTVLGFTLLLSLLAGILFGLAPMLHASKADLNNTLKDAATGAGRRSRNFISSSLSVAEIALALVLLVGTGLMVRSFIRLQQVDTGFRRENLLTMETFLPPARYPKANDQVSFYQKAIERIAAVPGVESVGASIGPPFTDASIFMSFAIGEQSPSRGEKHPEASYRAISPDYFPTMGIPLLKGRDLSEADTNKSPGVAIINESLARRHFPNEDPIGKLISIGDGYNKPREIVGIVADSKGKSLISAAPPEMYVAYAQRPWQWIRYAVRTRVEAESLNALIRNAVWSVDKDIPVTDMRTMDQLIARTVTEPRFYMVLMAIFGGVALTLAVVGIYGAVNFSTRQRTREIGIRLALGAQKRDVLKLVLGRGILLTVMGVVIGLIAAFALTRLMENLLFAVTPTDPLTFALMAVSLTVVALLACYIPARRATKVDPMITLRYE